MDSFNIENLEGFDNHRFVSYFSDKKNNLQGFIAIHRGNNRTPAFGATRILNYSDTRSALIDALKLSKTMSRKAALAGVCCGGAKAVIISDGKVTNRKNLLKSYACMVNMLGGNFITGADVGVRRDDVKFMRIFSRYFVGVKVDPIKYTCMGLIISLRTCLKRVFGSENIGGKSIAIQGLGKIGTEFLSQIYPYTKNIFVADIKDETVKLAKSRFPKIVSVSPDNIDKLKVDVFSPCALSNCLNNKNINRLNCSIIVGGANCQLESDDIGNIIYKKGILYAPDYLVNAGGLISVYDEYEFKNTRVRRVTKRVKKIRSILMKVFDVSDRKKIAPHVAADLIARDIYEKYK